MDTQQSQRVRRPNLYQRIIERNARRERTILGPGATPSTAALRRDPQRELIPDSENIRPAFSHDADRIIHCNAYARYIDKTQVFFLVENDHVTHRVLHVQMVAKISRMIARSLRVNEDLAEAIALGHDLGHAPFGHAGEEFIAEILETCGQGSFVHNAQSVRLLDRLENKGQGLHLSLQVLDGILGHNGEYLENELAPDPSQLTWEALDERCNRCLTQPRKDSPEKEIRPATLEGCIVRVADVFAYIGRDIEDAIALKLITRDQLPTEVTDILGDINRTIIDTLVMDVIDNSVGHEAIRFSTPVFTAMKGLLTFNYEQIYKAPRILEEKVKLGKVIHELFGAFLDDLKRQDTGSSVFTWFLNHMPSDYRDNTPLERIVADFMAGMTDRFLLNEYSRRFVPRSLGYTIAPTFSSVHNNPAEGE
jgi:dGTPase